MKEIEKMTPEQLDEFLRTERRQDRYGGVLNFSEICETRDFAFIENFEAVYAEIADIMNTLVNEIFETKYEKDYKIGDFIKGVRNGCYPKAHKLEDERKYKDDPAYIRGCQRTTRLCVDWELLKRVTEIYDELNKEFDFPVKCKEIPVFEDEPEYLFGIEVDTDIPYTHVKPLEKEVVEIKIYKKK